MTSAFHPKRTRLAAERNISVTCKSFGSCRQASCPCLTQAPERILDAPDITDDYYLNLLDWSSTNTVRARSTIVLVLFPTQSLSGACTTHVSVPGRMPSNLCCPLQHMVVVKHHA